MIEIQFENTSGNLGMSGSFESQISNINKRVDQALTETKNIQRKNNKTMRSLYSCTIQASGDFMSLEGVQKIKKAIDALIRAIEA